MKQVPKPDKEKIFLYLTGRTDPTIEQMIAEIVHQILVFNPTDIEMKRVDSTYIISTDVNWFLSEEELDRALEGWPVPDKRTGQNAFRIDTCLPYSFAGFAYFDRGHLVKSRGVIGKSEAILNPDKYVLVLSDAIRENFAILSEI